MSRLKTATLDVIAGLAAFGVVIAIAGTTNAGFDAREICIADGAAFFCAGLVRSRSPRGSSMLNSSVVGLRITAIVILLIATANVTSDTRLAATLALITFGMSIIGIRCGDLWLARSRTASVITALVPFSVVVAVSVLLVPAMIIASSWGKSLDVPAPRFTLTTADGSALDSSRWNGHVVVLSFWATWCAPCRQELPQIEKVAERYRDVTDVEFWAVGGPWGDDTIERERQYARQARMSLSLAFDGNRSAARAVHVNGFPSVVLLDKSGHLRFVHSGYDASESLVRDLSERIDSLRRR